MGGIGIVLKMLGRLHRPERKLASIKARLRVGDEWADITLINVSLNGLIVRGPQSPSIGEQAEIRRRGLRIAGVVHWSTATRFGVHSLEPIDIPALMARSEIQPDRRQPERAINAPRRAHARWMLWNK